MKFKHKLLKGTLIKRYKRFLADITLESGEIITAHCANSGSMLTVKEPGSTVWISPVDSLKAKLKYRWELIDCGTSLVGINTGRPNELVEEALRAQKIDALRAFTEIKREVTFGNSRFDFYLEDPIKNQKCFLEVKNVSLKRGTEAQFPDAVTTRGLKHVLDLIKAVEAGYRAFMCYVIQREDCDAYRAAADIDPQYAEAVSKACKRGVEFLCYQCSVSTQGITIEQQVPIIK